MKRSRSASCTGPSECMVYVISSDTDPGSGEEPQAPGSPTMRSSPERCNGHQPLPLPTVPVEAAQLLASTLPDGPELMAWATLNKTHFFGLLTTRYRLLQCALVRKQMLQDQPDCRQTLSPAERQRLDTSILLMRYLRGEEEPFRPPMEIAFRQTGAASLADALCMLDGMSAAHELPSPAACLQTEHAQELRGLLDKFWARLPTLPAKLMLNRKSANRAWQKPELSNQLLQIFLTRPRWQASELDTAVHGLSPLLARTPCTPEQTAQLSLRFLFLMQRCMPGFQQTEQLQGFLALIDAVQADQVQPLLAKLFKDCKHADAARREAARKFDPANEQLENALAIALEDWTPIHHPLMDCVDLLLFHARARLPARSTALLSKSLHALLRHEILALKADIARLPKGSPQEQFKRLLTEMAQTWSKVEANAHLPYRASPLPWVEHKTGDAWSVYELRVQRLCSVLRNLYHVMMADKKSMPALDLRGRLRELFGLWPTKPGRRALLGWLDD